MRRAAAIALVGLVLMLSGCGIAVDAAPTELNSTHTAELPATPTTDSGATNTGDSFSVYLIQDGCLIRAARSYNEPGPKEALLALYIGPLKKEVPLGITSEIDYIPNESIYLLTLPSKGTATVELDSQFEPPNLIGTQLALAFAQIVFTLTAPGTHWGIHSVQFDLSGTRWPAYLPDGQSTDTPVSYVVYNTLIAPQC